MFLNDFKEQFDMEKVNAIYICDNNLLSKIRNLFVSTGGDFIIDTEMVTDFLNGLKQYKNILFDKEYIIEKDGKTKIDIDAVYEKYKSYHIAEAIPNMPSNYLFTDDTPIEELMENAQSYILFIHKLRKPSTPKIVSDINGYCVFDVQLLADPSVTITNEFIDTSFDLVGVFNDEQTALEYINKRKNTLAAYCKIKNGKVIKKSYKYFALSSDGYMKEYKDEQ